MFVPTVRSDLLDFGKCAGQRGSEPDDLISGYKKIARGSGPVPAQSAF